MEKNFVGMGMHVCPVCCKEHTPVVLLDKRLKNTLTQHEFAGWDMCEEHAGLKEKGYIACVEVSNDSAPTLRTAERTGALAHVRRTAWDKVFNTPAPPGGLAFVQAGVIDKLRTAQEGAHE